MNSVNEENYEPIKKKVALMNSLNEKNYDPI